MYAVVLAGGGGTRLWPLSQPERPKPFLRLLGDESLIQRTVARLAPLIPPEDVYVIAEQRHLPLVAEQLPDVPASHLLGEPMGRNTAAAVALAAEAIDRYDEEVMFVVPADAHIEDEEGFRKALGIAAEAAQTGVLVTLGVTPNRPETGYGYVVARGPAPDERGHRFLAVDRFVEKPSADRAADLIATGLASWNAGIFAWTRATIRASLETYAPDIVGPLRAIFETPGPHRLDAAYPHLRATSIDYAIMEPASVAGRVAVVPMNVGWSDLGSWAALRDAWQARRGGAMTDGTVGLGNRLDLGSDGSLILGGDRLVVTIGVHDLIVIDTPDALLVCAAERSQDVREIAQIVTTGRSAAAQEENKP
jgi:mannose-1-phosphate guanylyltransferase/mannose-6-phosphate isomerase